MAYQTLFVNLFLIVQIGNCRSIYSSEDERGWATQGKTALILDNLIAEKRHNRYSGLCPLPNLNTQ